MTTPAPIFNPAGPLIGLGIGFVSYLAGRRGQPGSVTENLARDVRAVVQRAIDKRTTASPADQPPTQPQPTPGAPNLPPVLAGLPVAVGPAITGVATTVGVRTQVGAAFLTGYGIGTAFWNAMGTRILDAYMPKYDPNSYPTQSRIWQAQTRARAQAYTERRMARYLDRRPVPGAAWLDQRLRELQREQLERYRRSQSDRMGGLEEIRVTARPVPYPAPVPAAAPSPLARLRAWYARYQRALALAVGVFSAFEGRRKQPEPAAPGAGEFEPQIDAPATEPVGFMAAQYNVRPETATAPETETASKRCPPCRKGTARKRKKRDACVNPVVRRRKQTRDGRTLITTTRELKCQP